MFLIFCLSFVLGTVFFGEEGIVVRKGLVEERNYTQRLLDEKEAQVALLRERSMASSTEETYSKDLVHSFGEGEVYEPQKVLSRGGVTYTFHGFSTLDCFLFALIPTGLLASFFLLKWILDDIRYARSRRKAEEDELKQKEKEKRSYGSYDD